MVTITRNEDYKKVADSVKPDGKKRVHLPKSISVEDITYHVYVNSVGQIILDPQVTIPASELWVFEDKNILASLDRGMAETTTIDRGSFAKYVKNEP